MKDGTYMELGGMLKDGDWRMIAEERLRVGLEEGVLKKSTSQIELKKLL